MSKVFFFIAGMVSTIVLAVLAALVFKFTVGTTEYRVLSTVTSPDATDVATVYTASGGGGLGWCSVRVNVNPIDEPFSVAREQVVGKYMVFNVSCNTDVQAKWESNKTLVVTYRPNDKHSGITVYKTPNDWHRNVELHYSEQ